MPAGSSTQAPLLVFRQVSKRFGGVAALNEVSFEIQQGEMLGIIGPNGAGFAFSRIFLPAYQIFVYKCQA